MKLGAFSVSLNVKNINASKLFYENLGFKVFGGDIEMNYLIMKNENSLIGLFQGMFENNIFIYKFLLEFPYVCKGFKFVGFFIPTRIEG